MKIDIRDKGTGIHIVYKDDVEIARAHRVGTEWRCQLGAAANIRASSPRKLKGRIIEFFKEQQVHG